MQHKGLSSYLKIVPNPTLRYIFRRRILISFLEQLNKKFPNLQADLATLFERVAVKQSDQDIKGIIATKKEQALKLNK